MGQSILEETQALGFARPEARTVLIAYDGFNVRQQGRAIDSALKALAAQEKQNQREGHPKPFGITYTLQTFLPPDVGMAIAKKYDLPILKNPLS